MADLFQNQDTRSGKSGTVECLGKTFPNDEERRKYYLNILREKLKDPEFRQIEGFPVGEDDDILTLSDPPYYTACPNPFIEDFISLHSKPYDPESDNYKREPFASDVSEGKNDPIYNAHSYHTKVPHKAIMRYILHYTEPGDIVLDGFCGTGMTGVAAQLCGDKRVVESLGYKVDKDGSISQQEIDEHGSFIWRSFSKLGIRHAILSDLSPSASFIAYNYNSPIDVHVYKTQVNRILKELEDECGWMFETMHIDSKTKGHINYCVWSDVYICPECTKEVVFWEVAVDRKAGVVKKEFSCQYCNSLLTKRSLERDFITQFDKNLDKSIHQVKQIPVLINYSINGKRFEKKPDVHDLELLSKIKNSDIPYWFPVNSIIDGKEIGRLKSIEILNIHQLLPKRANWILSAYLSRCNGNPRLLSGITSSIQNLSWMYRWRANGKGGTTSGTYYICATPQENNPFNQLRLKLADLIRSISNNTNFISTQDSSNLRITDNSIDYLFLDPPFGANLMYSELNFLWESWLKVFTNALPEAIENEVQGKTLSAYQNLMTQCFIEFYRILKPGRWMTVEFHNSQNRVWNAIQEALQIAGFVIADIRTLDKQQGSFKQVTSAGAVKQDLIISAYKPNGGLEDRFKLEAGKEDGVWDFVRTHLQQLPVFSHKEGVMEVIAERQNYLLYDRMVAFHVLRNVTVPLTAVEFYQGLVQQFPERDGMFFLSEQVPAYDRKRMTVGELRQLELAPSDEHTSILWLRQLLGRKPQTFQDMHPQFIRAIGGWEKHEMPLELSGLLEENFLRYDGVGEVPSQIHSYISTNYKDLRNLPKDDPTLKNKAMHRWFVPDPSKQADLEKVRDKRLLKEFWEYLPADYQRTKSSVDETYLPGFEPTRPIPRGKKMKVIRLEAVRAGFKFCWQNRDYRTIIAVAQRIPESVLQEDQKLLMWYDQAITRAGSES